MTVQEIPEDQVLEMTSALHRAFNIAGCDPMCHCCEKMLPVGSQFKLAMTKRIEKPYWLDIGLIEKALIEGKEVTDEDVWKAHDPMMRTSGWTFLKGSSKLLDPHTELNYKQYKKIRSRSDLVNVDVDPFLDLIQSYQSKSVDVMLCEQCDDMSFRKAEIRKLSEARQKEQEEWEESRKGGCFRINGKIET